MRTQSVLLAVMAIAGSVTHAAAQDDGSSIANAAEFNMELLAGPNTGEPALPTPPPPRSLSGEEPGAEPAVNAGAIHLSVGLDLTNAYFSRGLRQEDEGLIVQPWATVGFDLLNSDDWSLQAYVGTWNSLHTEETGAANTEDAIGKWYESDAYFGLAATTGNWELGAQYGWFTSPNSAFTTVEELQLSVCYDDSDALGDWALSPSALLVIETGDGTSDGMGKGAYLQCSVEPGCECSAVEGFAFSLPVIAGFSASDYYEHEDGSDDAFGVFSMGIKSTYTIPCSGRFGEWSCYLAAHVLFLGDLGKEWNDDDGTAVVIAAGVSMEY